MVIQRGPAGTRRSVVGAPIGRVEAFDGLRGWLALCVVWTHGAEVLLPALFDDAARQHLGFEAELRRSPLTILLAADLAVRIFFVHSGFVLAVKYVRTRDWRWPAAMLLRRPVRLGLPVLVTSLLSVGLLASIPNRTEQAADLAGVVLEAPERLNLLEALAQGLFYNMLWDGDRIPGAWWTMPVELYGSMVLLATLMLWGRLPAGVRAVIAVVYVGGLLVWAAGRSASPSLNYPNFSEGAALVGLLTSAFALGAGVAWLWVHRSAELRLSADREHAGWWLVGLGALCLGAIPSVSLVFVPNRTVLQLVVVACAALVLCWVLSSPLLQRAFSVRLSRWLGRLSFMVYLVHLAVQRSVMDWLVVTLDGRVPYLAAASIALVLSTLVVLAISHVLALTVERVALSFGRHRVHRWVGLSDSARR